MLDDSDVAGSSQSEAIRSSAGAVVVDIATRGRIDARDDAERLVRFAFALTGVLLVFRLLMIGEFGFSFDEAYYWLWSQDLAFGYYDHPPMVALFIRAGTFLFGENEFGTRVFGTASVAIDALLIFGIARILFDSRRVGAWAAIFANLTTLTTVSVIVVPDQPMIMFWLAAFYGLARIARGGAPQWWLLVGGMLGLAAASKYTTFFLAAAIPIWLLIVPSMRHWFRSPWPYLAAGLAVVTFLPVLIWNAQHGWPSFLSQYNREGFDGIRFDSLMLYFGLLPFMITPPITYLAVVGLLKCLRSGWTLDPARALLVITPIPLAIFLAYYSFGGFIGIHWFSPIVCVAAILAAVPFARQRGERRARAGMRDGVVAVAFSLAVLIGFDFLLLERALPIRPISDFTQSFRGWDTIAAEIADEARAGQIDYVLAPTYGVASELRFYLRGEDIPVYQLGEWDRAVFGTASAALASGTALYVGGSADVEHEQALAEAYFDDVTFAGELARPTRDAFSMPVETFIVASPKAPAAPLFAAAE
jgi:4-amino-4-deoxy-L-arabinose transferase-like glycosyltransferase